MAMEMHAIPAIFAGKSGNRSRPALESLANAAWSNPYRSLNLEWQEPARARPGGRQGGMIVSTAPARRRAISKSSASEPPVSLKSAHELAIRLTLAPGQLIGPGKIALLEGVRAEGSISGAARAMGMSYKRAWELVDEINSMFVKPAVVTSKGGKTGGGALLSDLGTELIRAYRALEESSLHIFHAQFAGLRPALRKRPARP